LLPLLLLLLDFHRTTREAKLWLLLLFVLVSFHSPAAAAAAVLELLLPTIARPTDIPSKEDEDFLPCVAMDRAKHEEIMVLPIYSMV